MVQRIKATRAPHRFDLRWDDRQHAKRLVDEAATRLGVAAPCLALLDPARWPGYEDEVRAMSRRLREMADTL